MASLGDGFRAAWELIKRAAGVLVPGGTKLWDKAWEPKVIPPADAGEAVFSMENLPLPIIHSGFSFTARDFPESLRAQMQRIRVKTKEACRVCGAECSGYEDRAGDTGQHVMYSEVECTACRLWARRYMTGTNEETIGFTVFQWNDVGWGTDLEGDAARIRMWDRDRNDARTRDGLKLLAAAEAKKLWAADPPPLAAVFVCPDDDTPKLMMIDWCQENDLHTTEAALRKLVREGE